MIDYGDAPDNQLQLTLPGINDVARDRWDEAWTWKCRHYAEWRWYLANALRECKYSSDRKTSPNTCLTDLRRHFRISLPNAWAPAFARMAMAENPDIKFRMAKSMFDVCAEVKL